MFAERLLFTVLVILPQVASFVAASPRRAPLRCFQLRGWWEDLIDFATYGPSERRLKAAREKELSPKALADIISSADVDDDDDLTPAFMKVEIAKLDAAAGSKQPSVSSSPPSPATDDDMDLTPGALKAAIARLAKDDISGDLSDASSSSVFGGYEFAELLTRKWGAELDVDFRPVNNLGKTSLYVAIMPIPFGSRRCRHRTKQDYLMHLQAVTEVLDKYGMVSDFIDFVETTEKQPRANTSPLIAVTYRMNLTPEQVASITNST